jgi:phytanoyl-CoA hydroxylase
MRDLVRAQFSRARAYFQRLGLSKELSSEPMWFLADDPASTSESNLPAFVQGALKDIRDNGFAVLPGNVPPEACDAVIKDFEEYCKQHPESVEYRDEYGLHERLACLHLESEAARRVAFNSSTTAFLEAAFRGPLLVVGSLFFEKGSTQSIHRDTPAFFTSPLSHFFGVWNALEDVREGAGPLIYYRGGHKVAPDVSLYRDGSITAENYFDRVVQACRGAGLELVEFYPKKGDTLIWHPELPHGGAPITNPKLSRKSLVVHYMQKDIPIHGADVFFDPRKKVHAGPKYRTVGFGKYHAIDQGRPRFFHNRYEGNFDEH